MHGKSPRQEADLQALAPGHALAEISFLAGLCRNFPKHTETLAALGIAKTRHCFTTPVHGYLGASSLVVCMEAALRRDQEIGPELVMHAQTYMRSNGVRISGQEATLGIKVSKTPSPSMGLVDGVPSVKDASS